MENDRQLCQEILHKLQKNFESGKTKPYEWRISQLQAVRRLFTENEKLIAEALAKDLGRCFFDSVALELLPSIMELDNVIANLKSWMKPTIGECPILFAPGISEVVSEPYGVCLVIGAFNYPIQLTAGPFVGAIMAGNCCVMKPSEMSSNSEQLLATLIPKYLDNDCFAVVCGGISTTTALLELPWNKIFFTGSTRVGKIVMKAAAEHLTPVSLELGGKSPTYIDESVGDIELAATRIMWGKCANAGQTCIAPDYVLCHEKVYSKFLDSAKKAVKTFYGEDPKQSPDYGRIISTAHCERLKGLIDDASGALALGGAVDVTNKFVAPTILTNVRMDSKIMREEIFGPLLPVIPVKGLEEVVRIVKSDGRDRPLCLYIFAKNRGTIDSLIAQVPSGGVVVNDTLVHFANSSVPFGGVGPSGLGNYHGTSHTSQYIHTPPAHNNCTRQLLSSFPLLPP